MIETTNQPTLLNLPPLLDSYGLASEWSPASAEQPYEQLLLELGVDANGEVLAARVCWLNELTGTALNQAGQTEAAAALTEATEVWMLDWLVNLERQIPAAKQADLAWFAITWSQHLPFGSLGVDGEGRLYFRYVWMLEEQQVDPVEFLKLAQMTTALLQGALQQLEAWAHSDLDSSIWMAALAEGKQP